MPKVARYNPATVEYTSANLHVLASIVWCLTNFGVVPLHCYTLPLVGRIFSSSWPFFHYHPHFLADLCCFEARRSDATRIHIVPIAHGNDATRLSLLLL